MKDMKERKEKIELGSSPIVVKSCYKGELRVLPFVFMWRKVRDVPETYSEVSGHLGGLNGAPVNFADPKQLLEESARIISVKDAAAIKELDADIEGLAALLSTRKDEREALARKAFRHGQPITKEYLRGLL